MSSEIETNKIYGNLKTIRLIKPHVLNCIDYWECVCKCGNNVICSKNSLLTNKITSCGCVENSVHLKKNFNIYNLSQDYGIGVVASGEKFYFDLEDYDKLKEYLWVYDYYGYVRTTIKTENNKYNISMHKFLTNYTMVDHINRNGLDNRKENLRQTTDKENSVNKNIRITNKSGIIGVYWDKHRGRWQVNVSRNNHSIYIGRFKDKNNAIVARLKAEKEYYGKEYSPQRHLFKKYGIS